MSYRRDDKVFDKDGEQDAWGETLKAFRLNHKDFFDAMERSSAREGQAMTCPRPELLSEEIG